jgi:hypothetical protein
VEPPLVGESYTREGRPAPRGQSPPGDTPERAMEKDMRLRQPTLPGGFGEQGIWAGAKRRMVHANTDPDRFWP